MKVSKEPVSPVFRARSISKFFTTRDLNDLNGLRQLIVVVTVGKTGLGQILSPVQLSGSSELCTVDKITKCDKITSDLYPVILYIKCT